MCCSQCQGAAHPSRIPQTTTTAALHHSQASGQWGDRQGAHVAYRPWLGQTQDTAPTPELLPSSAQGRATKQRPSGTRQQQWLPAGALQAHCCRADLHLQDMSSSSAAGTGELLVLVSHNRSYLVHARMFLQAADNDLTAACRNPCNSASYCHPAVN